MKFYNTSVIRAAEIITDADYDNKRRRFKTAYGSKTVQGIADIIERTTAAGELLRLAETFEQHFGKAIDDEEPINGSDAVDFICEFIFDCRAVLQKATGAAWKEWPICSAYHPPGYEGDCRDDSKRRATPCPA